MKQTIIKYLMRDLDYVRAVASDCVCGINNPELNTEEKQDYAKSLKTHIAEADELIKCIEYLQPRSRKKAKTKA